MGLYVSTTGTNVDIPELGITISHPTTDRELSSQFTSEDIQRAGTLTSVIRAGTLIWKKTAGGATQTSTDYDPDFVEIENENTGLGDQQYRAPIFRDLSDGSLSTRFANSQIDGLMSYNGRLSMPLMTSTTLNGTHTITTTCPESHVISGTATGYKVVLPDARSLGLGRVFLIYNVSSQVIEVRNNNNVAIYSITAGAASPFFLRDNTTQAGAWITWDVFANSGAILTNYKITSSVAFSTSQRGPGDDVITGFSVTPLSGTYGIWYNAKVYYTTVPKTHYWSVYKAGSKLTDSERQQDTAHPNQYMVDVTMTTTQVNGSQAIDVRCRCANTGTLTVYDRSLILIRLGD